MIDRGKYETAFDRIRSYNDEMYLDGLILKCHIFRDLELIKDLNESAEEALKLTRPSNRSYYRVLALINKTYVFILGGTSEHILEIVKEAEEEFNSLIIDDPKFKLYLEASLLTCIGAASDLIGKKDQAINLLERGVQIWRELEFKAELARAYWYLAWVYNPETIIPLLEEALEIWKEFGNMYRYARMLCNVGGQFQDIGDFNNAIAYNRRALSISEKLGFNKGIIGARSCLGNINLARGESREAIQHFEKSLSLAQEMENLRAEHFARIYLGRAFFQRDKMRLALDSFERSLDIAKKIGVSLQIKSLFYMITASLALGSRSQAAEYYKQLQELNEYIQSDTSSAYSQLSKALILKSSHRLRDQMESQKLLEEILHDDKQAPWAIRILTLKNLCSLLLLEVEVNNDPEVFIEVKTKITEIKEITEKQHLFPMWIETLLFQAKLALVEGNLEEAEPLLLKAEEMAINMELGQMRRLVTEERKRLQSDLKKWEDLTNSNAPLRERIEKARLMDYTKTALDVRDTWIRRSIDQKMGKRN